MKKTWTRLVGMAMILLAAVQCNQEAEKIIYKGPDFVFFDSKPQISMYENQKTPLKIPLKVSLAQSTDTQVTFEVVGENVLPVSDYTVQTASPVNISRSSYGTTISILPIDNAIIQPEKRTIIVRIKSISNPAMSAQVVEEVEIDLLDDDCLPTVPKVSIWTGNVNIAGGGSTTTGTGEGGAGGICGGTLVVTGPFFGSANPSSAMTIILTQDAQSPTQGFASVVRFPLFPGSEVYEYEASGTYSETGKTITLNFSVYNTTDPTFSLTGTHIITPK
jgi:hypothetical protein